MAEDDRVQNRQGADDYGPGAEVGGFLPSGLLDAANRAIIEALQRDGRRPYGAIAEEVGLSEAAVRRRVQRLRENGVIQIVAVTAPLQLGFTRQAMVGIRVEGDVRQVAAKVAALDEVFMVGGDRTDRTRWTTSWSAPGRSTCWPNWSARMTTACCTC